MFAIAPKVILTMLGFLVMTAAPSVRAQQVQPFTQLLTQLMIENQGDNAGLLGLMFGPDPNSTLSFSSNVDFGFSYSTNPGTTYQGQSLTLSASGIYFADIAVLKVLSSGTLGGTSWTTSSSEGIFSGGGDDSFFGNAGSRSSGAQQEGGEFRRSRGTGYNLTDGTGLGEGVYARDLQEIPGSDFTSTHRYDPATGEWEFKETPVSGSGFLVNSQGTSPLTGGEGSFVVAIVPEPPRSLLFLGGLSVLWLAFFARRRFLAG
jgi:hypothetical protein